eukprot:Nk52_evm24s207 gene=Nk52_evmTU24s207
MSKVKPYGTSAIGETQKLLNLSVNESSITSLAKLRNSVQSNLSSRGVLACVFLFLLLPLSVYLGTAYDLNTSVSKFPHSRRLHLSPDYRDGINLFRDREDVLKEIPKVLENVNLMVNRSLEAGTYDGGYQLVISFGCFELLNIASGSGYRVRNSTELMKLFLPVGRERPSNLTDWSGFFSGGHRIKKDTLFRIASVSKIFTSLLAYILRDEGVISLDEEFASVYPTLAIENLKKKGFYRFSSKRNITLRMALNQMTGLRRDAKPSAATTSIIDDIPKYAQFTYEPFFHFEYSNHMTGLIGSYLSKRTGTPFEQLVKEKIIQPLNLKNTFPNFSKDLISHILIGGNYGVREHSVSDLDPEFMMTASNFWNLGVLNPTGGMVSTASDLSKVMQSLNPSLGQVRQCQGHWKSLLDPSSTREYLSFGVSLGNDLMGIGRSLSEIYSSYPSNHKVWSKSGALGSYGTWTNLIEDAQLSVSFSCNTHTHPPPSFFNTFLNEKNLIRPVREALKNRISDTYSGDFLCKTLLGDERRLKVKISMMRLNTLYHESDDVFLTATFTSASSSFSEIRSTFLQDYDLAYDVPQALIWSGIPSTYYIAAHNFAGPAGYGDKDLITLSESVGGVNAHEFDFSPVNKSTFKTGTQVHKPQNRSFRFMLGGRQSPGGKKTSSLHMTCQE